MMVFHAVNTQTGKRIPVFTHKQLWNRFNPNRNPYSYTKRLLMKSTISSYQGGCDALPQQALCPANPDPVAFALEGGGMQIIIDYFAELYVSQSLLSF